MVPYSDTEQRIKDLIGDITMEMSAEDYNKLPDMTFNDVWVELPKAQRVKYEQMEQSSFLL